MEDRHDSIQWMFPLEVPSQFNRSAPILTPAVLEAFRDDPALRDNLLKSFDRFLAFLGLTCEADRVVPASAFETKQWRLTEPDHNWLLIDQGKARITADTRSYWKNATFPDQPR